MADSDQKSFLQGAVAYVAVSGTDTGGALASGIARRGGRVALLTDVAVDTDSDVMRIDASFESRESVAAAFSAAHGRLGAPQVVVHSAIPSVSCASAPIDTLSYEHWSAATHGAVKSTLYVLQAAYGEFGETGGSIVVVGPSLSLVGAPGLVPLSTALEAQRSLVKSAARQWGRKAICINWVALGADGNYAALAGAAIPQVPELGPPPPALGRVPDLGGDAAALICYLGSEASRALTGATLNLDGGNWMVP